MTPLLHALGSGGRGSYDSHSLGSADSAVITVESREALMLALEV